MKKTIIYWSALALTAASLLTACSADDDLLQQGEGKLALSATLSGDLDVVSRADADGLRELYGESLTVWLTKPGSGPVRQYEGIDNLPSGPVTMPAGNYVAEAWAGDSVSASFDKKYFKAFQEFSVTAGATEQLNINCKIANVVASVVYLDGVDELLKDYTLEVGNTKGSVVFEGKDTRKGYFMMPKDDKNLTVKLNGTTLNGKPYTQSATIADVKGTTEYVINIKPGNGTVDGIGGAYFDISVDATEIDVNDEFVITLAPQIKGIGFDINTPVTGEMGKIGRRSVYITATEQLSTVVLESEALSAYLGGYSRLDLINAEAAYLDNLRNAGITVSKVTAADGRLTNIRVNFEEAYTNALTNGTFTYLFKATDGDTSNEATLTIDVSDAPVQSLPVNGSEISYTSVTLRANILKAPTAVVASRAGEKLGFNYRKAGEAAWTFVEGTVEGSVMSAVINSLTNDTDYEYQAVYDDFTTGVMTFATLAYPQLPNAGFEEWCKSGKVQLICASEADMWWDSGNHGSATMSKTLTEPDGSIKHSGQYSARLRSQYVGLGIIGAFAAGNLFSGHFLGTEETTKGILGWGRPFDFKARPTALTGWVKYTPAAADKNGAGDKIAQGEMDRGIIYIALLTDDKTTQGEVDIYPEWPVVVRTKGPKLFDETAANVVAYGKLEFNEATPGDGMIQFNIPIEAVNSSLSEAYIMIVASASIYGDYYQGGEGSTMWLDDLKLIY